MRQCPHCRKKYDDTWKICFQCNLPLEEEGIARLPADVREELQALKSLAASFNDRINNLEKKLKTIAGNETTFSAPEPGPAVPGKPSEGLASDKQGSGCSGRAAAELR